MVSIIAALTKDHVIGRDGGLCWHLPEDMKLFKRLTTGNIVIMGRKTYESIPEKFRPLPNRINIVVSRSMQESDEVIVARSPQEALEKAQMFSGEVFVIGGAAIYEALLKSSNKMYLSFVKKDYEGDTHFPQFNKEEWRVEEERAYDNFTLKVYMRK